MRPASRPASTRAAQRLTAGRAYPAVKVPQVVALFWVTKALTTAFGESASDWLVHALSPVPAVLLGLVAFVGAITIQLRADSYSAWRYWFTVAMVGVFGTMAADVLHIGFHVPYLASTVLFGVVLAGVFVLWQRVEGTVSVHSITTTRRELFYWAAVIVTFGLGTAVGDLLATVGGLGYLTSAVVFAALIAVPAVGYRFVRLNAVVAFWTAYVLTRPVGASVADWLGKPTQQHGVGVGSGIVTAVLAVLILAIVSHLAASGADDPTSATAATPAAPPELTRRGSRRSRAASR